MGLPPLSLNAWLRYDVVKPMLDRLTGIESVLEIGAGGGARGARLAQRFDYLGLEPDRESFERARERVRRTGSGDVLNGSVEQLDAGRSFDLVCAFEVLEHIEDDAAALHTWGQHLRPGGWLLISVPAWRSRWGASDRRVGHVRRYDRVDVERLVEAAGFPPPEIWVYGFPLGNLLHHVWNLAARRSADRGSRAARTASSGRWLQPPEVFGRVSWAVAAPFRLAQRPFLRTDRGTGIVALTRRPD